MLTGAVATALAVGAGVAALAAVGGDASEGAKSRTTQDATRDINVPWQLVDVGRGARGLELRYLGGGCFLGDGRANVRETRDSITISVVESERVDDPSRPSEEVACTGDQRFLPLRIQLRSGVDGRRVEGGPRLAEEELWSRLRETPGRAPGFVPLVPRVIGLSPGDAVELLGHQGFHARTTGAPVGSVIRQRPRPGAAPRGWTRHRSLGTVTIVLGR
jgi:hypothetical protein